MAIGAIAGIGGGGGYGWVPVMRRERTSAHRGGDRGQSDGAGAPRVVVAPMDGRAAPPLRSINMPLPWLTDLPKQPDRAIAVRERLNAYAKFVDRYEELDHVIELMLTEARDSTLADGGTFYLATDGGALRFAYFQNATISSSAGDADDGYTGREIPIDDTSICGHVARSGRTLSIPDAYALSGVTYEFNRSYDDASGYRTVSMLTVPILEADGSSMAVLQLINKMGPDGAPMPFSDDDASYAEMLAHKSAPFLRDAIARERARAFAPNGRADFRSSM